MVSTSTTNPGLRNLFINKPKQQVKRTNLKTNPVNVPPGSTIERKIAYKVIQNRTRESQKKAWKDALSNNKKGTAASSASTSSPSNGSSGSNTSSSSGSGITTLDDASADVSGNGDGGSSGDGNSSDSSGGSGTTSPLLEGSMSFEELVGEICNGIDLIFATKRTTVVVTDYESIYAEAKYLRDLGHKSVKGENINLWQLEEGTYELEVSEYGFYNTVRVHYKNGVVTEDYQDLVKVYGVMAIDYYDTKIDKTTAIMKAKAYLAAHVRDFDMAVKAQILFNADIDIGDIVTLENPLTLRDKTKEIKKQDPEYFFVKGKSIQWEGDTDIIGNLELRYGAESPERKDVPETGTSYSSGSSNGSSDIDSAINEVGKMAEKIKYSHACQTHDCVVEKQQGDCHGMSDFIACELKAQGIEVLIKEYPASASNHRSVLYKNASGKWTRFPYRNYKINELFRDTDGVSKGQNIPTTC